MQSFKVYTEKELDNSFKDATFANIVPDKFKLCSYINSEGKKVYVHSLEDIQNIPEGTTLNIEVVTEKEYLNAGGLTEADYWDGDESDKVLLYS